MSREAAQDLGLFTEQELDGIQPTGSAWVISNDDPATVPVPLQTVIVSVEGPYTERDRKLWVFLLHAVFEELGKQPLHTLSVREIDAFGPINAARKQREQRITAACGQAGVIVDGRCPQMEMSVLGAGQKSRRARGQRFPHSGKYAKLLRDGEIIPCPDMTRCSDGIAWLDTKRADIRQSLYPGQREPPG